MLHAESPLSRGLHREGSLQLSPVAAVFPLFFPCLVVIPAFVYHPLSSPSHKKSHEDIVSVLG